MGMSMAQKFGRKGISFAQMKSAVGQEDYTVEEVFHWFDRDDSGAIDIYEFIFGIGWICGYYEYEPTDEDIMALEQFWWDCDTDIMENSALMRYTPMPKPTDTEKPTPIICPRK